MLDWTIMKRTAQTYIAQHESGEEIAASLILYIRDRNKLQLIAQLLLD